MKKTGIISVILLCFLLAGTSKGLAAEASAGQERKLVVWLKDGEKVYYDLEESPKTTFTGSDVIITTDVVTVSYPMEQVLRYTYDLATTDIENLKENEIHISQHGNSLGFENLKSGTVIKVYSIDGTLKDSVSAGGSVTVSLDNYSSGVYIIKVNGMTYKVLKK